MRTKEELIKIDDCEILYIFDYIETQDGFVIHWLLETDPQENNKTNRHRINPEDLIHSEYDFEEYCQEITRASVHNPGITFINHYFDEEVIEEWVEDEENYISELNEINK